MAPKGTGVVKKVDSSVRSLLTLSNLFGHRAVYVIVGDAAEEQIPTFYSLLCRERNQQRLFVLWCYEKTLHYSSNAASREKQAKRRGQDTMDFGEQNPILHFQNTAPIRYVKYNDASSVLGQTFSMLILQDVLALTPSILAKTLETVDAGGAIILTLRTMSMLSAVHDLATGLPHSRPTGPFPSAPRFAERFLALLARSPSALVIDDELNVLKVSADAARTVNTRADDAATPAAAAAVRAPYDRAALAEEAERAPAGIQRVLAGMCRTSDQMKAVVTAVESLAGSAATTTLLADRGRGKSATLGLVAAGAIATGHHSIVVVAPSAPAVQTLFEFAVKGLSALGYREHTDFTVATATAAEVGLQDQIRGDATFPVALRLEADGAVRTLRFVAPAPATDATEAQAAAAAAIDGASLVIVDEAAALDAAVVTAVAAAPVPVFVSSTIQGYEGAGRLAVESIGAARPGAARPARGRRVEHLRLETPIRYSPACPAERLLRDTVLLDARPLPPAEAPGTAADHTLCWVNRDALFSGSEVAEKLLAAFYATLVTGSREVDIDYIQYISDEPQVQLYMLAKPSAGGIPRPSVALAAAVEGAVIQPALAATTAATATTRAARDSVAAVLQHERGTDDLAATSGLHVLALAAAPGYDASYPGQALRVLGAWAGRPSTKAADPQTFSNDYVLAEQRSGAPAVPSLLIPVVDVRPHRFDWLAGDADYDKAGVLLYVKGGFTPLHVALKPTPGRGHRAIFIRDLGAKPDTDLGHATLGALRPGSRCDAAAAARALLPPGAAGTGVAPAEGWLASLAESSVARLAQRLWIGPMRELPPLVVLATLNAAAPAPLPALEAVQSSLLTDADRARLSAYCRGALVHQAIADALPAVAVGAVGRRDLPTMQGAVLTAMGLQRRSVDEAAKALGLQVPVALRALQGAVKTLVPPPPRAEAEAETPAEE